MRKLTALWRGLRQTFAPGTRRILLPGRPKPVRTTTPLPARLIRLARIWRGLLARRICLAVDCPGPGEPAPTRVTGLVELRGWAYAPDGIARVEVSCDG